MRHIIPLHVGDRLAELVTPSTLVVDGYTATARWHWVCPTCEARTGDAGENDLGAAKACTTCATACVLVLEATRTNPRGKVINAERWTVVQNPHNRLGIERFVLGAEGQMQWAGIGAATVGETRRLVAGLHATYATAHLAFAGPLPRTYHQNDAGVRDFLTASAAVTDALCPTW